MSNNKTKLSQGRACLVFSLQGVGTKMSSVQFWRNWPSQSSIYIFSVRHLIAVISPVRQRHWSLFSTYWRYTNKIIIIIIIALPRADSRPYNLLQWTTGCHSSAKFGFASSKLGFAFGPGSGKPCEHYNSPDSLRDKIKMLMTRQTDRFNSDQHYNSPDSRVKNKNDIDICLSKVSTHLLSTTNQPL